MNTLNRRPRALLAALALTLALAGPASAATSTQQSSETLTVQSTVSLTGLPTSLAYGSGVTGSTLSAPAFTLTASTNSTAGLKVVWAATNLTSASGSIAASNRYLKIGSEPTGSGGALLQGGIAMWANGDGNAYTGTGANGTTPGTDQTVATSAAAGDVVISGAVAKVKVPANAVPGSYAGTLVFRAIEN